MVTLFEALLATVCLVCTCGCLFLAAENRRSALAIAAAHDLAKQHKELPNLVRELEERLELQEAAHKRLTARVGMREVRDKRGKAADGRPDWRTDPEGFLAKIHRERGLPPPALNGSTSE